MVKSAFTMIEVIFVIVILGILTAVAMPKFAATRDDAKVVILAQQIAAGVGDIAMYATSTAKTEDNLSKMSNVLNSLEKDGVLVINTSQKKGLFKAGSVNDCIVVKIDTGSGEDNLTLSFGSANGDAICTQLQKTIPSEEYPMKLRGANIVY